MLPRRLRTPLMTLISLLIVGTILMAPSAGPTAASGAAGPAAAGARVTLKIMHWTPSMVVQTPWWKDILDGFTATHPNVSIENNFVTFPQYLPTLTSMAAARQLPDVFFAHVKAAELGRAGRTINYRTVFPPALLKRFYASPLSQFTFDNKQYALPWTAQVFGFFVDTPIMKKLGLRPPQTWDDLIAMTPKIRAAGYTPLAWGNQARNACPDFFLPLVTQEGGDVHALDDLTKPGLSWRSGPVIRALTLLQRLAQARVFLDGINGVTEEQGWQIAWHGKAAMLFTGSWVPQVIDRQAPTDYARTYTVIKLPALTPGGRHWTGDGSGEGWAINAHSPNKALAIEFVKYLFSPAVYGKFIRDSQSFPSMPSAVEMVKNPKVRFMLNWLSDGSDHILFGKGSWDALSNVCQAILDGSQTPRAGAAQIEKSVLAARSH